MVLVALMPPQPLPIKASKLRLNKSPLFHFFRIGVV